jgi:GAF domain-containing protein
MTEMDFAAALAAMDQPRAAFAGLEALSAERVGHRLFTLMTVDADAGLARRAWSNMPDAYPVSGAKPLHDDEWSRAVMGRHETWVMNSIDHIARYFPDHALIASLGCQSCLNLPVPVAGQVLGTVNILGPAGHFTPERIAAAETLRLPAAAAFLLAARLDARKDRP